MTSTLNKCHASSSQLFEVHIMHFVSSSIVNLPALFDNQVELVKQQLIDQAYEIGYDTQTEFEFDYIEQDSRIIVYLYAE